MEVLALVDAESLVNGKNLFHHGKPRALWVSKTGLFSLIILTPSQKGLSGYVISLGLFIFHFSEEGSEIKFWEGSKSKAQRNRLK